MSPIRTTTARVRAPLPGASDAADSSPVAGAGAPLRLRAPTLIYRPDRAVLDDVVGGCTLVAMLCLVCMLIVDGFARDLVA